MQQDGATSTRMARAPLVGRSDELAAIAAELDSARGGTARIVLVTGEPGIGKTALCRTAVEGAQGFRVLRAGGEASESDLVYGVVDQLLAAVSDRPAASLGATPLAVGAALLQLISDLEAQGPVLVWIDDLQWADPASQRALLFVLRRLEADPVLVLLCQRAETPELTAGLARHLDGEGCRRLALLGLSELDLAVVADATIAHLPRSAVRRLHEHTGGNPLWALALLRETPTARLLEAGSRLPAPRSFAAIVAERLAGLSPEARGLVEACAVAGGDSALGLLDEVAALGASFAAMSEAASAQLLTFEGMPPLVRVGHALIASAVYDGLQPNARVALHAAFARNAPTEHERLRHEIAASPGHDSSLSARVAEAAVARASGGAWSVASDTFRSAARLSATLEMQRERLEHAMAAALMAGEAERGASLADELRVLPPSPRLDSLLGWLALIQGKFVDAERLLLRAVHIAEEVNSPAVVAEACRMLTHLLVIVGRAEESAPYGRRALALDPPGSMEAGLARGNLVMALANNGQYRAALQESLYIDVRRMRPDELIPVVARGTSRVFSGDFRGAVRDLSAVIEASRAIGTFDVLCAAWAQLSDAQYRLGDWDSATGNAEQAVQVTEDAQLAWAAAPVHAIASSVPSRRGNWEVATTHVMCALQAAARTGESMSVFYAANAAAILAHSRGSFRDILPAGERILKRDHRTGLDLPGVSEWQPVYAEALVRLGRLNEAEEFLSRYQGIADEFEQPWPMACARRVCGLLRSAQGGVDDALKLFTDAHELAAKAGTEFEAGLIDLHHGQVLRRHGSRKDAGAVLSRGLATFTRLGAAPFADLAVRELSAVGVNGKGAAKLPASHLLTRQELAVSRLVGSGLSNRDIAAELFISTKTVEFHLGNAYRKLGVSSRTQLVRHLAGG